MLTISEIMSYQFKNDSEIEVFKKLLTLPQVLFNRFIEALISGEISYEVFTDSKLRNITRINTLLEESININIEKSENINNQTFKANLLENIIFPRLRGDAFSAKMIDATLDEVRRTIISNYSSISELTDSDIENYERDVALISYSGDASKIALSAEEIKYIDVNGIDKNRYLKEKQLSLLVRVRS